MQGFDVLDTHQSILGNLLIEASAGTGKTFTIEHTVLRLVKEEKIPLHKILLLTFTEASQKDLMVRVLGRLKKENFFGFLEEMPILTFQKFIHRFLNKQPDPKNSLPLHQEIEYFLLSLEPYKEFGPRQLQKLFFSQNSDTQKGLKELVETGPFDGELIRFDEALAKITAILEDYKEEPFFALLEDFTGLEKADRELFRLFFQNPKKALDQHLLKKSIGFKKIAPKNIRVKRAVVIPVEIAMISTFIEKLQDSNMQMALFKQLFEAEKNRKIGSFSLDFDLFLQKLEDLSFLEEVSTKFEAVVVDEFQDTDPRQWEILSRLFFKKPHIKTFMVVGDPKQSIYRFRNADYTSFFAAKEALEKGEIFHLTTSYRSSIRLTNAINSLFEITPRPFDPIEYTPVLTGRKEEGLDLPVELVVFEDNLSSKDKIDAVIHPWIHSLIQHEEIDPYRTAILVNNRFEATALERYLRKRHVPVKKVDKTAMKDRLCFQQFLQLLQLLKDPFDKKALRTYHFLTTKELLSDEEVVSSASYLQTIETLRTVRLKALSGDFKPLLRTFEKTPLFPLLLETPLCSIQDIEELYEKIYYHSETLKDFNEGLHGVEIITTFSSKGLEYETVIALSLATDDLKEEHSAEDIQEKMRLFYVGCTRSKEKLILPVLLSKQSTVRSFLEKGVKELTLENLKKVFFNTLIHVTEPLINKPHKIFESTVEEDFLFECPPKFYPKQPAPLSFSGMDFEETTIEKAVREENELPLGLESGVFIHKILEKIFSDQSREISKEIVDAIVKKTLFLTPYAPFKEYIHRKLDFVLNLEIDGVLLKNIHPYNRLAESPFSFIKKDQRVEGVYDLLVFIQDKIHIIDYKLTHPRNLSTKELMEVFHYDEQGKLYKEAIQNMYPLMKDKVEMHFIFLRNEVHYVL
jgi:exodeoxyribonuclease V beta subunit